jgi:lycopene cyclase domain-containing protein
MRFAYVLFLLGGLASMVLIDRRFRLFFWRDARRAALVLSAGIAFFVVWDACGIALGIFSLGETSLMTGILIGPQFPLEELFFLAFLCYLTMVLVTGFQHVASRRRRRQP